MPSLMLIPRGEAGVVKGGVQVSGKERGGGLSGVKVGAKSGGRNLLKRLNEG